MKAKIIHADDHGTTHIRVTDKKRIGNIILQLPESRILLAAALADKELKRDNLGYLLTDGFNWEVELKDNLDVPDIWLKKFHVLAEWE